MNKSLLKLFPVTLDLFSNQHAFHKKYCLISRRLISKYKEKSTFILSFSPVHTRPLQSAPQIDHFCQGARRGRARQIQRPREQRPGHIWPQQTRHRTGFI